MKTVNIKILIKKIKHSFVNIGSDADKDWRIVFSLLILSTIVSIIWHANLYINIGNTHDFVPREITKSAINIKELDEMIVKYNERADEFQSIQANKKVLIDPAQ